jgi:hypothetical protein
MQITCESYDTTETTEKYLSGQKFSPKFFYILMNVNPTISPNFVEIGGLLFFCPFPRHPLACRTQQMLKYRKKGARTSSGVYCSMVVQTLRSKGVIEPWYSTVQRFVLFYYYCQKFTEMGEAYLSLIWAKKSAGLTAVNKAKPGRKMDAWVYFLWEGGGRHWRHCDTALCSMAMWLIAQITFCWLVLV